MEFEYVIDLQKLEESKKKNIDTYNSLKEEKEKLEEAILKERKLEYEKKEKKLEEFVNEALKDYKEDFNKEKEVIVNRMKTKVAKRINELFVLDLEGNTNLINSKERLEKLLQEEKVRVDKYNNELDNIYSKRKEIFERLNKLENYKSLKEDDYKKVSSEKIERLNKSLEDINKKINNFWNVNKLISDEEYAKVEDIFNKNPQNRNTFNKKIDIINITKKEYIDEENNIKLSIPIIKRKDNFSTIFTLNDENSIEDFKRYITTYVIRMLFALNVEDVKVNIVDVKENGLFFDNLIELANKLPKYINSNVIFDENGVTKLLQDLNNLLLYRTKVINKNDIYEYNNTADKKEEIKIYVINNYERVFKDDVKLFENLLKLGSKYGIYLLLVSDIDIKFDSYTVLLNTLHKKSFKFSDYTLFDKCYENEIENIKKVIILSCNLSRIKIAKNTSYIYPKNSFLNDEENLKNRENSNKKSEKLIKLYYDKTALNNLITNFSRHCEYIEEENKKKEQLNVDELIAKIPRNQNTIEGIKIPIGVNAKGEFEYIEFSDKVVDALLTGITGSGKSSLYQYLLLNGLYMYDKDELEIYILDLKEGIEFSTYANYYIPNIKWIYGNRSNSVEILAHLSDEITRRSILFNNEKNVRKIEEYRRLGKKMPRILLLVDEFQMILGDANTSNELAKSYLSRIITQGRAEGIHVIICSQNLDARSGLTEDIKTQLTTRIVLRSAENSADIALSSGNTEESSMSNKYTLMKDIVNLPTGKGIINSKAGVITYNRFFRFPNVTSNILTKHLEILSKENKNKGVMEKPNLVTAIENNISQIENVYFKEKLNLNQNPVAILGKYMRIEKPAIKIGFEKEKNSNILVCTKSLIKINDILESFFTSLAIWNKYNKNKIKVTIFDFYNISKDIVNKYIDVEDNNFIELVKYQDNIETLTEKLDSIISSSKNNIINFVIINRIDMYKEYYDNVYSLPSEIEVFITKLTDMYNKGFNNNITMLSIANDGISSIEKTMNENSKFYFYENNTIFNEYYSGLLNKKFTILFKNMDEMPNSSVEIYLYENKN